MEDLKKGRPEKNGEKDKFKYPVNEDIYNQGDETNIDPDALIENGARHSKKNYREPIRHLPDEDLNVSLRNKK